MCTLQSQLFLSLSCQELTGWKMFFEITKEGTDLKDLLKDRSLSEGEERMQ